MIADTCSNAFMWIYLLLGLWTAFKVSRRSGIQGKMAWLNAIVAPYSNPGMDFDPLCNKNLEIVQPISQNESKKTLDEVNLKKRQNKIQPVKTNIFFASDEEAGIEYPSLNLEMEPRQTSYLDSDINSNKSSSPIISTKQRILARTKLRLSDITVREPTLETMIGSQDFLTVGNSPSPKSTLSPEIKNFSMNSRALGFRSSLIQSPKRNKICSITDELEEKYVASESSVENNLRLERRFSTPKNSLLFQESPVQKSLRVLDRRSLKKTFLSEQLQNKDSQTPCTSAHNNTGSITPSNTQIEDQRQIKIKSQEFEESNIHTSPLKSEVREQFQKVRQNLLSSLRLPPAQSIQCEHEIPIEKSRGLFISNKASPSKNLM